MAEQQLSHDGLVRYSSKENRDIKLECGVFSGGASVTVWGETRQGGPLVKFTMPPDIITLVGRWVREAMSAQPGFKRSAKPTKWNPETKKADQLGTFIVGRDEEGIYLGIQGGKLSPTKFPMRLSPGWDVSGEYDKAQASLEAAEAFCQVFATDIRVARMLTSFKREMTGGRGGFGGGGGNRQQRNAAVNDELF